jgi:hypothetical protein
MGISESRQGRQDRKGRQDFSGFLLSASRRVVPASLVRRRDRSPFCQPPQANPKSLAALAILAALAVLCCIATELPMTRQ